MAYVIFRLVQKIEVHKNRYYSDFLLIIFLSPNRFN